MGIVYIYRDLYTCIFVLGICGMDGICMNMQFIFSHILILFMLFNNILIIMCMNVNMWKRFSSALGALLRTFLGKKKFLKSIILFLKYIKYIYLYTNIPILFELFSVQISTWRQISKFKTSGWWFNIGIAGVIIQSCVYIIAIDIFVLSRIYMLHRKHR